MSTALVIVIVVAVVVVVGLLLALPAMRRRARARAEERELSRRRELVADSHRREAETHNEQADLAERHARIAEQEAARARADAQLHAERAELHDRGLADDELYDENNRLRPAPEDTSEAAEADQRDRLRNQPRTNDGQPGLSEADNGAVAEPASASQRRAEAQTAATSERRDG